MQIFFLNGLWRLFKNGHLPVKLHSSAPPGSGSPASWHRRTDVISVKSLFSLKLQNKNRLTRMRQRTMVFKFKIGEPDWGGGGGGEYMAGLTLLTY